MKRVGLVTVTYVDNFGSHLQSFALQEIICELGYDAEVISIDGLLPIITKNRKKYAVSKIWDLKELWSYFPLLKWKMGLAMDKDFRQRNRERKIKYLQFSEERYRMSPKSYNWNEFFDLCKERYCAVIVGSDQLWRPANIAGEYYTLEHVPDDINKIAYSTSFGIDHIIKTQSDKSRHFLSRINYISVRENTGKKIVYNYTGREIHVVCDPVFLLAQKKWISLIDVPLIKEKYIFCYFLSESNEYKKFAYNLKKDLGLTIVAVTQGERYTKKEFNFADYKPNGVGPLEFLNLIYYSEYVCTDSFHGCAFSIILNKQFTAFYKHKKRGMSTNDRLDTMLEWTGLSNRIYNNVNTKLISKINYEIVNEKVEKKISESLEYLTNALKSDD